MKIIEKLSEMIDNEIDDAMNYAECALKHKEDNATLANTFSTISSQELNHITMLHEEVVKLINQYRSENGEAPEAMKAVYDYLHGKHIKKVNEIKIIQAQFRA